VQSAKILMTGVKSVHNGAVMKTLTFTKSLFPTLGAVLISCAMAQAQSFDAAQTAHHQALASAPRSLEAYPWLSQSTSPTASARLASGKSAKSKPARALAANPRALEDHPELARAAFTVRATTISDVPAVTLQNAAVAASPRVMEEFPALSRGTPAPAFEIAPLK